MNSTILRYTIPFQPGVHTILMPIGSCIISVDIKPKQRKHISIWAIVNPKNLNEERTFQCIQTNEPVNANILIHHKTIVLPSQEFALHVFEEYPKGIMKIK